MPNPSAIQAIAVLACMGLALPSFAAKLQGDYEQVGTSLFEKLSFRSGSKVHMTFMGMTKVGTFEVDGKEVLITINNETNVFTIDDKGCVVGGGPLGTYCKGGAKAASAGTKKQAQDAPKAKPVALSGKYRAGDEKAHVTLDFMPKGKVRILIGGSQTPADGREATYTVAGDTVTVADPDGGSPLVLTRKGSALEGSPDGEEMKMKFVKQ